MAKFFGIENPAGIEQVLNYIFLALTPDKVAVLVAEGHKSIIGSFKAACEKNDIVASVNKDKRSGVTVVGLMHKNDHGDWEMLSTKYDGGGFLYGIYIPRKALVKDLPKDEFLQKLHSLLGD